MYDETRILNPPYAQRSYSSIWSNNHFNSLLDDLNTATAWNAQTQTIGQWMQIDVGSPMRIVGIITQGRGIVRSDQYVTEFSVEYHLDNAFGYNVSLPEIFSRQDTLKSEHIFTTPIYAQYIRIIVKKWNGSAIAMRAALIVESCSSCLATSTSVQGSKVESACKCPGGGYKHSSAVDQRALALVPGRAQLSTLRNRGLRLYAATAQFNKAAGPSNSKGAITFDRAASQYIDGGPHQFNIGTNGFTAVAVVKFTKTPAGNERIFDFANGADNDNIAIVRSGDSSSLYYSIRNSDVSCFIASIGGMLVQDTWLTIVGTYNSSDMTMRLKIGNNVQTPTVCTARTDRIVSNTYVGKNNWLTGQYSSISILGLYVVDALLTEPEIMAVVDRINAGEDTLQVCKTCPLYAQGRADATGCECMPGAYSLDNSSTSACFACPVGKFKTFPGTGICSDCPAGTYGGGITCSLCPAGTFNTVAGAASVASCLPCKKGSYNEIQGGTSSASCLSCAAGKFHRKLGASSRDDCKDCACR
jgi:hypothetical protein